MTAIQAIALVCLPFVWVMLANGPSRGAMRRMRRNARRGGVPEDVAFDRWMKRNGRNRETVDRLKTVSPEDQAAFALVVSAVEEIREAMERGELSTATRDRVLAERSAAWSQRCGPDIARRASAMLERCGPAALLIPGELERAALDPDRL